MRDDGSTDDTLSVLKEYAVRYPNLEVEAGERIGVVRSFFELLRTAPDDTVLVSLCDQDDVWEPGKISRAVERLSNEDDAIPRLYLGRMKIVDEYLRPIGETARPKRPPALQNALVQAIAAGCTMVLNRAAHKLLACNLPDPKRVIMHDWWIYQVIAALGVVEYDDQPHMLYRQHQSNVFGCKTGLKLWWYRARRLLASGRPLGIVRQAAELDNVFRSQLPEDSAIVLQKFVNGCGSRSLLSRFRYSLTTDVYRQSRLDCILMRILLVSGRL